MPPGSGSGLASEAVELGGGVERGQFDAKDAARIGDHRRGEGAVGPGVEVGGFLHRDIEEEVAVGAAAQGGAANREIPHLVGGVVGSEIRYHGQEASPLRGGNPCATVF